MENMDENHKAEYKKILDELMPIPELKRIDNIFENLGQVEIKSSKKFMGPFLQLHKPLLFKIFSYFSFDDLEKIKTVPAFFILAENKSRTLLREILNATSKIYVTPQDLLRLYDTENLTYILNQAKNMCKDFLLENGDFKENWKILCNSHIFTHK